MKIWVVGRDYPTVANNMWGSFEFEQAKLLAEHGHNVSYISLTLSFFSRGDKRGFRTFEDSSVKVYACSHLYFPGKISVYLEKFEDKCWEKLMLKAFNDMGLPDIIHIHYPSMIGSINVIESYRKKGAKIFVTEHWSRVLTDRLKNFEINRLAYYAEKANCFFSVGKPLQDAVRKKVNVSVPMEVIPNNISPAFSLNEITDTKKKNFVFLAVGRLTALKQFDVIIREFNALFNKNDSVRLKIIGSGEDLSKLKNEAGNSGKITFTGTLSKKEVAKEMANADALVSYSKYETFCVPIVEALFCGKPVISSDTTGVSSFINKKLGIVADHKDPNKLREAMNYIYNNIDKYDPKLISDFANDNFSGNAIYHKFIAAYTRY